MISLEYCRDMASYNRWMNERLYETCARLPDEERRADRGAFFKSIHGTLNHLLATDTIWLRRFRGESLGGLRLGIELHADFAGLRAARAAKDVDLREWVSGLDAAWLARPFSYTSLIAGQSFTRPAWLLVTHLFNHQTHHRGQVTTLLTQQGIDPGVTDLVAMPEVA